MIFMVCFPLYSDTGSPIFTNSFLSFFYLLQFFTLYLMVVIVCDLNFSAILCWFYFISISHCFLVYVSNLILHLSNFLQFLGILI